jgi:carbon monoxide dehydrogenase subunit G
MKLEQSFTVEAPVHDVWAALIDVQRVAPCLPGAEITEAADDGSFKGTFTV